MDTEFNEVQLIDSEPFFSSQDPSILFSDSSVAASMTYGIEENPCPMNTMDTSQMFQPVLYKSEIVTDSHFLATVVKVAEDVVDQTALITNDIAHVLFANLISLEKQTVADTIKKIPVYHVGGAADNAYDIEKSIKSLDLLIDELQKNESISKGRSPGFATKGSNYLWVLKSQHSTSYEVLPSVNLGKSTLPLPDADIAVQYLLKVRKTWVERLRWVSGPLKTGFCSCISKWEHHNGHILSILANQAFEQVRYL